jgi:hypothetical protein
VRGCACRGTAGFAHLTCLAEQTKILVTEALENNLDDKTLVERFGRWNTCSLCEQEYHGPVLCALGWACWRTYLDDDFGVTCESMAIDMLAKSLIKNKRWEEALRAYKYKLPILRTAVSRDSSFQVSVLGAMRAIRLCLEHLGRADEALLTAREIYREASQFYGSSSIKTLDEALRLSNALMRQQYHREAKQILSAAVTKAENVFDSGKHSTTVLNLKNSYAAALYSFHFYGHDDYRGDLRKALVIMEELVETFSLVYGPNHNRTMSVVSNLRAARQVQLDWRVDDLTPATIASFGMAKLTIPEKAATLYAIEQLSSSASALEIREYAERCLGAPQGYLDAKKAAIDDLWREAQSG